MENNRIVQGIEERGKGKYWIIFDDGLKFVLYKGEVRRFGFAVGEAVSADIIDYILSELLLKRGKDRALYLLQSMSRTKKQIQDKLLADEYPPELIEQILEFLERYHYLDDESYVRNYIESRMKTKSLRQIKAELIQKGVDSRDIEAGMEEFESEQLEEEEMQLMLRLLKKKHKDIPNATREEKQKLYAFLARKGFSGEKIQTAIRRAEQ